jgi:hypothetical protein
MSSSKKDLLDGCMDSISIKSTVEEFKQAFCDVCLNPECVRSAWSNSLWDIRMRRQEGALFNPNIVDPESDPLFLEIAKKSFDPVSPETKTFYGGWVDVTKEGKVVHYAEPDTQVHSAEKVDQTLTSLKNASVEERPEGHVPKLSDDPQREPETPSFFTRPEPDPPASDPIVRAPRPKSKQVPANTPDPGGVLIQGSPLERRDVPVSKPSIPERIDPWAAPPSSAGSGPTGGKITVRISDGTVVKKE